jgi:predicted GIY-YIG superfamily endonuclease
MLKRPLTRRMPDMQKLSDLTIKGESGEEITFEVYPFNSAWPEVGAVYLVTKREKSDSDHTHTIIYIGQTDNLKNRFSEHHKAECFEENDANCVCIHRDAQEKSRLAKEKDLLGARSPDCND